VTETTPEGEGPSFQPGGYRPKKPEVKPFIKPIAPERPKGSIVLKVFLVCLLGVGAYGGYYGYCRSKVGDREYAMMQQAHQLHGKLMMLRKDITAEDIRTLALQFAEKARVKPYVDELQVTIEEMNETNLRKLPPTAQMAMGLVGQIPKADTPRWIVGFKGRFWAKHGVASKSFELERYTWFQYVKQPTQKP
jgi:hypothetical protein